MAVAVVFEMGKRPATAPLEGNVIRIGREPGNDLILPSKGVSRRHATLVCGLDGRWLVKCDSSTNPIVVNGTLITAEAELSEGTEILIGPDHLLTFSLSDVKARQYMGSQKYYAQSECTGCHWMGLVSVVRKDPVCPRCGSDTLAGRGEYVPDIEADEIAFGTTEHVNRGELRRSARKLKTAKRSRLERIDGRDGTVADLTEEKTLQLAARARGTSQLFGFIIGTGVEISWNGNYYVATSSLSFPALRVNGVKQESTPLKSGDVVEIGKNRFKFSTE